MPQMTKDYAVNCAARLARMPGFPSKREDAIELFADWVRSTESADLLVREALAFGGSWSEFIDERLHTFSEFDVPEPLFEFLPRPFLDVERTLTSTLEQDGFLMRVISRCDTFGAISAALFEHEISLLAKLVGVTNVEAERLVPLIAPYFEPLPTNPDWLWPKANFIGRIYPNPDGSFDPGPDDRTAPFLERKRPLDDAE
jgi:hypothetical protein